MRVCALPALCCCWQCGSDGQPPSERFCSYKSFLWDPSDAVKANGNNRYNVNVKLFTVLYRSVSEQLHCVYLKDEELGSLGFTPSLLQP